MWVRDLKSPPRALALFQVYHRFAPLTSFSGPVWRYQVDQDVSLQAFLLPGQSQGSFLHLRRGPTISVNPPLMRIEGQLESLFPEELPLEQWLAQGTRWWLRNLGSVELDGPLKLALLHGLAGIDQQRYADLAKAIAYHPVVPLCDGTWLSADSLQSYDHVYSREPKGLSAQPGWHEGYPVIQQEFAECVSSLYGSPIELLKRGEETIETPRRWSYSLEVPEGRAELQVLSVSGGLSTWILGSQRCPVVVMEPLFKGHPLAFCITLSHSVDPQCLQIPTRLKKHFQSALLDQGPDLLRRMSEANEPRREILRLAALLVKEGRIQISDLKRYRLKNEHQSLADLLKAEPEPPVPETPAGQPDPHILLPGLNQLNWTQPAGEHRLQARFTPERDGLSRLFISYGGQEVERVETELWPGWPVSLEMRLFMRNRPRCFDLERTLDLIKGSLLQGLNSNLRLLATYPEAFHEICCLTGIALEAGRTPPGWVWDCANEEGRPFGLLLGGKDSPSAIRRLLDR